MRKELQAGTDKQETLLWCQQAKGGRQEAPDRKRQQNLLEGEHTGQPTHAHATGDTASRNRSTPKPYLPQSPSNTLCGLSLYMPVGKVGPIRQ